jgi:hypothetical protein
VHSYLIQVQEKIGYITQDDIKQSLKGKTLSGNDVSAYTSIIVESSIEPKVSVDGSIRLLMKSSLVAGGEDAFLGNILLFLSQTIGKTYSRCLENFKEDCQSFFSTSRNGKKIVSFMSNTQLQEASSKSYDSFSPSHPHYYSSPASVSVYSPIFSQTRTGELAPKLNDWISTVSSLGKVEKANTQVSGQGIISACNNVTSNRMNYQYNPPPERNKTEAELSEPIVKLLAQVRKQGMDILFPKSTHDKILAAIYVAVKSTKSPAHRELIDMVMVLRESGEVSQLEQVSKTKVRGVLALLKHGEILETQGVEGFPVKLVLSPNVNSFEELRDRHDTYLTLFSQEYRIEVPLHLWADVVWESNSLIIDPHKPYRYLYPAQEEKQRAMDIEFEKHERDVQDQIIKNVSIRKELDNVKEQRILAMTSFVKELFNFYKLLLETMAKEQIRQDEIRRKYEIECSSQTHRQQFHDIVSNSLDSSKISDASGITSSYEWSHSNEDVYSPANSYNSNLSSLSPILRKEETEEWLSNNDIKNNHQDNIDNQNRPFKARIQAKPFVPKKSLDEKYLVDKSIRIQLNSNSNNIQGESYNSYLQRQARHDDQKTVNIDDYRVINNSMIFPSISSNPTISPQLQQSFQHQNPHFSNNFQESSHHLHQQQQLHQQQSYSTNLQMPCQLPSIQQRRVHDKYRYEMNKLPSEDSLQVLLNSSRPKNILPDSKDNFPSFQPTIETSSPSSWAPSTFGEIANDFNISNKNISNESSSLPSSSYGSRNFRTIPPGLNIDQNQSPFTYAEKMDYSMNKKNLSSTDSFSKCTSDSLNSLPGINFNSLFASTSNNKDNDNFGSYNNNTSNDLIGMKDWNLSSNTSRFNHNLEINCDEAEDNYDIKTPFSPGLRSLLEGFESPKNKLCSSVNTVQDEKKEEEVDHRKFVVIDENIDNLHSKYDLISTDFGSKFQIVLIPYLKLFFIQIYLFYLYLFFKGLEDEESKIEPV